MNYKKILYIIFFSIFFNACGDVPLFTEMKTNRLKVVIKGTLETEDISRFTSMPDYPDIGSGIEDDSVVDMAGDSNDRVPTSFMFDIAELRLDGKKFANYRQIHEFSLEGTGSSEPFFNGEGVVLKNDDPGDGYYDTVQVYIRKMIFDNAMIYTMSGTSFIYEEPAEVIFHENDRHGFDVNQLSVNSYVDSLRENSDEILRTFPLKVPIIGGLNYSRKDDETVLEIRFVIKNYIKKFEYEYHKEGVLKICHYYSFSDWLRDVQAGESDIGRNLHAVARAYVPGKTAGTITVSATSGNYVVAIPSTEDVSHYYLPSSGATLRSSNVCDMPHVPTYPGSYIEAVLDYYLAYEQYKNDWNNKLPSCQTFDDYEAEWTTYEDSVKNFKIAPYVAYSASGTAMFTTMAPGTYNFYEVSMPAYGDLFLQSDFSGAPTPIGGTPVIITSGQSISIP